MNCNETRKALTDERVEESRALTEHLNGCRACGRYAERLEIAREALGEHHAGVTPDPAFAVRVLAGLPPLSPPLGWAAVRLLPAAAALLLVLSGWAWLATATPSDLVTASPTDDLVSWVLENGVVENGGAE